jgi:hypothetical protein
MSWPLIRIVYNCHISNNKDIFNTKAIACISAINKLSVQCHLSMIIYPCWTRLNEDRGGCRRLAWEQLLRHIVRSSPAVRSCCESVACVWLNTGFECINFIQTTLYNRGFITICVWPDSSSSRQKLSIWLCTWPCPCLFRLFTASGHQKLLQTAKHSAFQPASIKFVWVKTI